MASETIISTTRHYHPATRNSYKSNLTSISMRLIVLLGLAALVCDVRCKDPLRGENSPRHLRLLLKDKRGLGDQPLTFPSQGPTSYPAPVHSGLSPGFNLGGSSGGFSLGQTGLHSLGGSIGGQGIGYSLSPSAGGYLSSGLGHGSLSLQGVSLGGHAAQSTYSMPSLMSFGFGSSGGNSGLFSPSKNGPVTFGLHGGGGGGGGASGSNSHSAPVYASGSHGLSAYSSAAPSISLPVMLASHGSSYGLSLGPSGSSHPITGGLIIASGSHGPSSYSLPVSGSSHGISALSSSSGSHGASPYALPITSGSHGISALSSGASSSGSYSSHAGLSSASSDSSNYELPISTGSYSSPGSSSSSTYTPHYLTRAPLSEADSSSSYSSGGHSGPVTYAAPSSSYSSSSSSGYSGAGASYSALSSSNSYTSPSASYSSPGMTYASYAPIYSSPSDSYGAYASVSPRYLGYTASKLYDTENSGSAKYDTISYSTPDGKY